MDYPQNVKVNNNGTNNEIIIKTNKNSINRINLRIEGNNNKVILEEGGVNVTIDLHINGNNNLFFLDKMYTTFKTNALLFGEGQKISIGKHAHFGNVGLNAQENTSIIIGNEALFSYQVEIRTTDSHSVLSLQTGERINPAKNIKIGNHVWIGTQTIINKGVEIADDVIVGAKALVVKSVLENHVSIGGVPAKIIQRNVTWSFDQI